MDACTYIINFAFSLQSKTRVIPMLPVDLRQNVVVTSVTTGLTTSASVLTARRANAAKVTVVFISLIHK